jgi:hypothetical protein
VVASAAGAAVQPERGVAARYRARVAAAGQDRVGRACEEGEDENGGGASWTDDLTRFRVVINKVVARRIVG